VKKALNIWPVLPMVIERWSRRRGVTNIIPALKQHNRVCKINIKHIPKSLVKKLAAMKNPFPALTDLELESYRENAVPVLPDAFLGGSAPRLQLLRLFGIPFPGLPKLLLTTSDLVTLSVLYIPQSGHISPEAMVSCLSALTVTKLEHLSLGFRSPRPRVDGPGPRLPTHARTVLPALTYLDFKGTSEYLEYIVSRIDAPRLGQINITFFNQLVFDTPQLQHFISRTQTFHTLHRAEVSLSLFYATINLFQRDTAADRKVLSLQISCRAPDWQLSSLSQSCSSSFPPLLSLERLEILNDRQSWHDDVEHSQWFELLHPFVSVKDLVIHEQLVQLVALALQELIGERVTEVLPALQNLYLEVPRPSNPIQKAIVPFLVARRISGRPVVVYHQEDSGEEYVVWEVID
jgi:hypothetical protein